MHDSNTNPNQLLKADLLTEDDLYASLGFSHPDKKSPSTNKTSSKIEEPKSKFLTNQYTLLSTGAFTIYLQGVLPTLTNATEENRLWAAFNAAVVRRIARGMPTSSQGKLAVEAAISCKPSYYTDKEKHKEAISRLVSNGVNVEKDKVVNRAFPLAAIDAYLNDLAEFLTLRGFDTPEEYLQAQQTKESSKLTEESISTFDWDSL